MDTEEFNALLAGPLHHPMIMFQINRLALALLHVVEATGEKGAEALREFARLAEETDEE